MLTYTKNLTSAGQIQSPAILSWKSNDHVEIFEVISPAGFFALISTIPNLKANELTVVTRALRAGLMILSAVPCLSQPFASPEGAITWKHFQSHIQVYCLPLVHSSGWRTTWPLRKNSSPNTSAVKVGFKCKFPAVTNELERSLTYHWNSLLPPPQREISCLHLVWFNVSKLSSKSNWPEQICAGASVPLAVVVEGTHWVQTWPITRHKAAKDNRTLIFTKFDTRYTMYCKHFANRTDFYTQKITFYYLSFDKIKQFSVVKKCFSLSIDHQMFVTSLQRVTRGNHENY